MGPPPRPSPEWPSPVPQQCLCRWGLEDRDWLRMWSQKDCPQTSSPLLCLTKRHTPIVFALAGVHPASWLASPDPYNKLTQGRVSFAVTGSTMVLYPAYVPFLVLLSIKPLLFHVRSCVASVRPSTSAPPAGLSTGPRACPDATSPGQAPPSLLLTTLRHQRISLWMGSLGVGK